MNSQKRIVLKYYRKSYTYSSMITFFFIRIWFTLNFKINILTSILQKKIYIILILIFSFFLFSTIKLLVYIMVKAVLSQIYIFTLKFRKYLFLFIRTLMNNKCPFFRLFFSQINKNNRILLLFHCIWFFKGIRGRIVHFIIMEWMLTIWFMQLWFFIGLNLKNHWVFFIRLAKFFFWKIVILKSIYLIEISSIFVHIIVYYWIIWLKIQ